MGGTEGSLGWAVRGLQSQLARQEVRAVLPGAWMLACRLCVFSQPNVWSVQSCSADTPQLRASHTHTQLTANPGKKHPRCYLTPPGLAGCRR